MTSHPPTARVLCSMEPAPYGRLLTAGEPLVFHCNKYNYWLQQTLLLDRSLGMREVMVDAAAASAHSLVSRGSDELGLTTPEERLRLASDTFAQFGFGTLDLTRITTSGGEAVTPTSHFGQCLVDERGSFQEPQNLFDAGYAAGAAAAAYGLPAGSFGAEILACHSVGDPEGRVALSRRDPPADFFLSHGEGVGNEIAPPPPNADTNVDELGILEALSGLDFSGNEEGLIHRFGVMLTLQFGSYLNRVVYEFVHRMVDRAGMIEPAEALLVEAGHRCGFHTLGGVMTSPEWDAVVRPQCRNEDDWIHGIVAVINALGYGTWRVEELTEDRLVVRAYDGYESRGYKALFGRASRPTDYLVQGGAAGLFNLIRVGKIADRPILDDAFYETVLNAPESARTELATCESMGDDYTSLVVTRGE